MKRRPNAGARVEGLEQRHLLSQVGLWTFDDGVGTTAADTSGSGTNTAGYKLTLTSSPAWQSVGQTGGSLAFNGTTQYGDAGQTPGSASTLSVSLWFKASSLKNQVLIDKTPNDTSGAGWRIRLAADGSLEFGIGSATNSSAVTIPSAYLANTWTAVTATFSGGVASVYLNGTLAGSISGVTQTVANTITPLRIANASAVSTTDIFGGSLDQIRVYDQLLGATPVARQYSVDTLTESTTPQKLKKADLDWAVEDALADEAFGNVAGASATYADIQSLLGQSIGTAQSSPTNLFPTIPNLATNPIYVEAQTKLIKLRDNNARLDKNPATYTVTISGGSPLSAYGGFYEDGKQGAWAIGDPQTAFYVEPKLLKAILRRFERVYSALNAGVSVADFGQSSEIAQMYLMFKTVYPDLLLPSKKVAWENALRTDADKIMADHASVYLAAVPGTSWVNADIRYIAALGYDALLFPDRPDYGTVATSGVKWLSNSVYPDGGLPYTDYQNEDFTYHGENIWAMARYWQITGDLNAKDIVTKSYWYYPLSVEATGVVSYATDPTWKHYWNTINGADVAYLVGTVAKSPENMAVFQKVTGGSFAGLGSLELAGYYDPTVVATPWPDNYITYDRNDLGLRGRFGTWSFSGSANPITGQPKGVGSFVGAMLLNDTTGSWNLNAALDAAQTRIRYSNTTEVSNYNQQPTFYDLGNNVHANLSVTDDYAAISSIYNASRYGDLTSRNWIGQQEWLYTTQRLLGLVSMRSAVSQSAYDVEGILKLVSGRATWGTAKSFTVSTDPDGVTRYTYGNMSVRIIAQNYGTVYTDYIDTLISPDTPSPKEGRIRFIDPQAVANGGFDPNDPLNTQLDLKTSTYAAGTTRYYMVEIMPANVAPASSVSLTGDPLSTNLRGMELTENGRTLRMIDNPTAAPITHTTNITWANGAILHFAGEQYRPDWLSTYNPPDTDFRGRAYAPTTPINLAQGTVTITVPAYSHIVLESSATPLTLTQPSAPTIATPAAADPSPANGTKTQLSVLAADDHGEGTLVYHWAVTSKPAGSADPTFAANNTNAAKSTNVFFTQPGTYTLTATATNFWGLATTSSVTFNVGFGLFSGSADIGSPVLAGGMSFVPATGMYTVSGAGTDIASTADQFHYAWNTLAGDGQIVVRVVSSTNTNAAAKSGLMFRDSSAANSSFAMVSVFPNNNVRFDIRTATGATATSIATIAQTEGPVWVKLVRAGNVFNAFYSLDGSTWTQAGTSQTVAMASNALAGLAVTSKNTAAVNNAVFDNVTLATAIPAIVIPASASPSPVTGTSTALSVLATDDAGESNLTYTWTSTALPPGAASPTFSADGSNLAKNTVATFSQAGSYTFAVTIRDAGGQSVTSSVNVIVNQTLTAITVTPPSAVVAAGTSQQFDAAGSDQFGQAMTIAPSWSATGGLITTAGLFTAGAFGGTHSITATSGSISKSATITVSNPSLFTGQADIGATGLAGSNTYVNGVYTLKASSADIWGTADAFRYVYVPFTGDGQIIARVNAVQNTNAWAKAGVMFRESLAAGSREAMVAVSYSKGVIYQSRSTINGSSISSTTTGVAAPYWIKLVRTGNSFAAYRSPNGTTWTKVGSSTTVAMGSSIYVGLALSSHNNATLNTSTFDNVSIAPLTNLSITKPTTATGTAAASAAANAVDGSTATSWQSAAVGTKSITVDLGTIRSVERITLNWAANYAKSFQVQVSSNNSTWTTLYTTTAGKGGTADMLSLAASGRYVRVLMTVPLTTSYGLNELSVFGR